MDHETYESAFEKSTVLGPMALDLKRMADDPKRLAAHLRDVLTFAFEEHEDKVAVVLAGLYLAAVNDVRILPFVVTAKHWDGKRLIPRYGKEVDGARDAAAADRAYESALLLHELGGIEKDPKKPMGETRAFLLVEIAGRWAKTKDESESWWLFAFLCRFYSPKWGDKAAVTEAMRKAGGSSERLRKCYVALAGLGGHDDDILRVLAVGWARNARREEISLATRVTERLAGATAEAHEFAIEVAECLVALEARLADLRKELEAMRRSSWGDAEKVTIRFRSLVEVEVRTPLDPERAATFGPGGRKTGYDENKAHDEFAGRCAVVEEWRKRNPDIRVMLVMKTIPELQPYSHRPVDVFPFRRERIFG